MKGFIDIRVEDSVRLGEAMNIPNRLYDMVVKYQLLWGVGARLVQLSSSRAGQKMVGSAANSPLRNPLLWPRGDFWPKTCRRRMVCDARVCVGLQSRGR